LNHGAATFMFGKMRWIIFKYVKMWEWYVGMIFVLEESDFRGTKCCLCLVWRTYWNKLSHERCISPFIYYMVFLSITSYDLCYWYPQSPIHSLWSLLVVHQARFKRDCHLYDIKFCCDLGYEEKRNACIFSNKVIAHQ